MRKTVASAFSIPYTAFKRCDRTPHGKEEQLGLGGPFFNAFSVLTNLMSQGKVSFHAPDGRRYANRVQVNSIQGRFLFRVSPAQAHRMVLDGAFTVDTDGKRAYLLILQRTPPCDPQPFTRVRGLRDFSGTRYVYRELVGHGADGQNLYAFQFRNISVWDQWAFNLAQKDVMTSAPISG